MLRDTLLLEFKYRGFCPEIKSCGFADGELFSLRVNDYINVLNN